MIICLAIAFASVGCSCISGSDSGSGSSRSNSIDGTYYWEDFRMSHTVTISGSRWSGTNVMYDQVTYDHGSVHGNGLYDSSGYFQVARVSGNSINWGNHTLRKQ